MSFGKRQPSGHYGVERRRVDRVRGDLAAQVLLPDYLSLQCTVTDYSPIGGMPGSPVGIRIAGYVSLTRGRLHSARADRAQGRPLCGRDVHQHRVTNLTGQLVTYDEDIEQVVQRGLPTMCFHIQ